MAVYQNITNELEIIRSLDPEKILYPERVVTWAEKHRKSVLYSRFEWEDTEAARLYRLDQARSIIRVSCRITYEREDDIQVTVRGYKSLTTNDDGGYSQTGTLMNQEETRLQLLNDTLTRLESIDSVKLFPELDKLRTEIRKARFLCPKYPLPKSGTGTG